MTGHSPDVVAETVARRVREGITLMLPTEDALWVGEDLKRRFGLSYWQFTLTATDANPLRHTASAREITQRRKILVFHYCYHGTERLTNPSPRSSTKTAQSALAAATSVRP